ncbi:MAG TPA: polyphenol oxidase family protein [Vicinamibacterales bacterium]|nr:polyphenol oxidase family protein [Vicinamibacterales bacterium]
MTDPQPTGPFEWTQEPWGRALRCTRLPAPHLFTSRDVILRDNAGEWAAVARSLGVTPDRLRLLEQVHGVHAAVARRGDALPAARPEADIIVTDDPSIAVGVRTADCAAVLLYDAARNVAGAAHAGWRGTAANAAGAAVRALREQFGSRPSDLTAAIGPLLGRCCGEVGPEVIDAFRAGGADAASIGRWFAAGHGDRSLLDLERANADQLTAAGLDPARIFASGLCTRTEQHRLHSYRAHGRGAGRLLAAIRVDGT